MANTKRKSVRSVSIVSNKKLPAVVYGLEGIMTIFNVSKGTAWRYRHSIIADACTQNGNVIVVDVKKALKLFGLENPESIVKDPDPDSEIKTEQAEIANA